jgi:hypothetical protein
VIGVVHHQHGGPFSRVAWDPETSCFDILEIGIDGRVNVYYQEFISVGNWDGFPGGRIYMGWIESS